ncbi:unnamed protein product [Camellia sinensis]
MAAYTKPYKPSIQIQALKGARARNRASQSEIQSSKLKIKENARIETTLDSNFLDYLNLGFGLPRQKEHLMTKR